MNPTTTITLEGILTFLNSMTLSAQNKRWLGEHLIEQAAIEDSSAMDSQLRKAHRVRRRSTSSPSDSELEARFAGLAMPELPADPEWSMVISANSGKTIRPIEKWL